MADVGEIRAKLVAETDQFEAGMQRAADATEQFSGEAEKHLAEVNKSLKSLKWAETGQGLERMGSALRGAGADFQRAAGELDDLGDSLKGAFGDSADQVADWSNQIGTAFGVFSGQQVGGAATALKRFGDVTEEQLRRVADIAAGSGQSIESVAVAYGKFEKFGDSKSLLALQKQLGVTSQELGAFGAVLDSNGKILADTPARAEAARAAMEQLLDEKFGGAMERQSDASAQLAGNLELLKQELGAAAFSAKEEMAPALLELVQFARDLPEPLQAGIGLVTEFGGMALQAGGQGLQMAANLSTLGLSMTSLRTAMAALVGPTGLFVIGVAAVAALAVGFAAYTAELEKANNAAEDLLATEEKRNRALHQNKELIGKTADEYRKLGKNAKDAQDVVIGLQEQISTARANGASPQVIARLERDLATAQAARKDLSDDPGAPKNVAPQTPRQTRVEESEKQRAAREKKEAAAKAAAEKKAEADRKKREREEAARKRREEAKRRAEEAKRQRDQTARQKADERRRRAAEKAREREAAKAEKERQAKTQEKKTEKATEKAETKAVVEQAVEAPGFFDQFAQDSNTVAFKEVMAKNAAARAASSDVVLDDRPRGGAIGLAGALLGAGLGAISPEAAAGATAGTAAKPGSPAEQVGEAVSTAMKDGVQVTLIVQEGGRSRTESGTARPGKPAKFQVTPLGGISG